MKSKIHIEEIKQNAKSISLSHDSLVHEMLKVEKHKIINKKIKSTINVEANLNLQEVFDVIEELAAIRKKEKTTDMDTS